MAQATHRLSLAILVILGATVTATPGVAQRRAGPAPRTAEQAFLRLTPREKLAQLVMPWIPGTYASETDPAFLKARRWVDSLRVGGVIISVGSPLDVAAKLNILQRDARVPLLVASDLESGTALRLVGGTPFPSNMGIGATGRDHDAWMVGRITALEGRAVGIHLAFAPVADVNSNAANPIINTRSFGADPRRVSSMVAAEVRGLQEHGMLSTAKHFPGHGDVSIDSHLALSVLDVPWSRLDTLELAPFRAAIRADVAAVMTAHMAVPVLAPGASIPATLVPGIVTGVLRDSLRFRGIVVTDAMNMGAVISSYGAGEAAVLAFLAGADILLQPADPAVVIDALVAALASGRITQARVDSSLRRVLALKQRAGLFAQRTVKLEQVPTVVGNGAFRDSARAIAGRSIVLLRDRDSVFTRLRRTRGVRSLVIYGDEQNLTAGGTLAAELRARGDSIISFRLTPASGTASYDSARAVVAQAPTTIFAVAIRAYAGRGTIVMPDALVKLIDGARATPTALVSLGSPYIGGQVSTGGYLLGWSANATSEWAVAAALTGAAITGRMPVPLPPDIRIGDGIPVK